MSICLGSNIRYLRKLQAMSQVELGAMLNKGGTTIGNWESDKAEPNIIELITLCDYFKVSLDDLISVDLSKISTIKPEYLYVSEPESTYGETAPPAQGYDPTNENKNIAIIQAQRVTIETLQKALQLAEEQIKFLKKSIL